MDSPIWISVGLALAVHRRQLAEHGGAEGVRDQNLLNSALARPIHLFAYRQPRPGIPQLAATLAFGIARNHAFIDGNKRTAAVLCETFLELNDYILEVDDAEMFAVFLSVAAGELSEAKLEGWLAQYARPAK